MYEYEGTGEESQSDAETWIPGAYRVPVFNMVDILGEAEAQRLLEYGFHGKRHWFCVKSTPVTANALAVLNRAAWWFEEAIPEP
jgi:hypothetical protein